MNERVINRIVFASLLLLALPSAALAVSPSQIEKVEVRVNFADLDIHSEADAKIFYTRVERASKKACSDGTLHQPGLIKSVREAKICSENLVEKVVTKIDSEEVWKIHKS